MNHYDFGSKFHAIYDKALAQYAHGRREAAQLFSAAENDWLAANGITAQHLFDYAEDYHTHDGEPGYDIALDVESVRRDYFINVQAGRPSATVLKEESLAPKTQAVQGIEWLPRIIPKAKAKLRGELPQSLMYCCGGDRRFFKEHDILPSEFLSLVWRHERNDAAIIDWVVRRSGSKAVKAA